MAWLTCDEDGQETIFERHPKRESLSSLGGYWYDTGLNGSVYLPKGSIKKLIGRELFWSDSPIELK